MLVKQEHGTFSLFKKIVALGRLRFLTIGIALYVLGSLLALLSGAPIDTGKFAFGYAILFFGHLSVHYSNDYFDFQADRLNRSSATSGGSGILSDNPELLGFSKWFGLSLAILSVLGAFAFTFIYKFPPLYLFLGIFGNLISWYYTAPPVRMAYRQWGVLASAFSVGFLMPVIGDFSLAGGITTLFLIFSIPLYLQALSFLISVQIPDMESDRIAGKHTFVAEHGQARGFFMVMAPLAAATLYYMLASFLVHEVDLKPVALLSLLPLCMSAYSFYRHNSGKEMAIRLIKYNVIVFAAFLAMLDAYFALTLLLKG